MVNLNTDNVLNSIKETAAANSAQSQAFAREEMRFNAEQSALSRTWQENMSNTAHQREVKDLIAAGLNPILSTGGQGASTPSGATAVGSKGSVDESYGQALAGFLTSMVNSATQVETARLSADALIQSSANSANATRYAADMSSAANRYSADRSAAASMYGSSQAAAASRYGSDKSAVASIWNTQLTNANRTYIAKNYPSSIPGVVNSLLRDIFPGSKL